MTSTDDVTFFSTIDQTKDPEFFKRFLDEVNRLPDKARNLSFL
jgi:hypothetical protein